MIGHLFLLARFYSSMICDLRKCDGNQATLLPELREQRQFLQDTFRYAQVHGGLPTTGRMGRFVPRAAADVSLRLK